MAWTNTTTTSTSANWTLMPVTYWSAPTTPAPRPKTALEWLDDEIEATCKLARQAA